MSFILDALRKSEHERQRAAMPGVAQVPFGLPRRELPAWATGLIVVLVVALLGLGGAWWRSARSDATATGETSVHNEAPLALPAPPPSAARATNEAAPPAAQREPSFPAQRTAAVARQAPPRDFGSTTSGSAASGAGDELAAPDRTSAEAPAPASRASPAPSAAGPTLPSPAALAAEGIPVPPLRLELHAFAARPADRFVFINGTKYVEGARLAEGPEVVSIEPNGAVLSYLGHRFLLATQ